MKGRVYPVKIDGKDYYIVRFGREMSKTLKYLPEAERFLTGLRFKTDEGSFDLRDYTANRPLAFDRLAIKRLSVKEKILAKRTMYNYRHFIRLACEAWGSMNVKVIGYGDLEDFLFGIPNISDKTRSNVKSCLREFWS